MRLVDLATPSGGDAAREEIHRRRMQRGLFHFNVHDVLQRTSTLAVAVSVAAMVGIASVLVPWWSHGSDASVDLWLLWLRNAAIASITTAACAASVVDVLRRVGSASATMPAIERIDRVRAEATAPTHVNRSIEGTVRALTTVRAPVSGDEVVAARVVGGQHVSQIDDAVCGSFEVLGDDGSVIARVEGQHFAVDLLVEEHATRAASSVADRDFFTQRGVHFEAPAATLHEAALRDGDRVTLSGPARDVLEASGFRGSRSITVFRGEGSYPVAVRTVAGERVRVALDTSSETENDTHDEAQGSNDAQASKRQAPSG